MVSMMKVFAVTGDTSLGEGLLDKYKDAIDNAESKYGHKVIKAFSTVDDLANKVAALLTADPDHPCLSLLEIKSHANPTVCNSIDFESVAAAGGKLRKLKWCDTGSIYLSGCNTALTLPGVVEIPPKGPLAQRLAKAMWVTPGTFESKITVFGTVGYLNGTHMKGDTKVTEISNGDGPFRYNAYDGATDAKGTACWQGFKNWS